MRKKEREETKKGSPAYMTTYADMMTLLLTFFILLFSMSSIDASKFKAFIESFSTSHGIMDGAESILNGAGIATNDVDPFSSNVEEENAYSIEEEMRMIKEQLEKFVAREKLEYKVEVTQDGDEVILRLEDILLFDTGKADIKPAAVPVLSTLGQELSSYVEAGYRLRFEGHTDNVPIKTMQFPSNWELSAARAIAVAQFFVNEMDFEPHSISAEGSGEFRPIADNDSPEGRSKNRRVEIKITKLVSKQE